MSETTKPLKLHFDEERFWNDLAIVLSRVGTDKQGAFCVGLVSAISLLGDGYPSRKVMLQAARQDPRAFHERVIIRKKASA